MGRVGLRSGGTRGCGLGGRALLALVILFYFLPLVLCSGVTISVFLILIAGRGNGGKLGRGKGGGRRDIPQDTMKTGSLNFTIGKWRRLTR